eukprot:917547-Rhodomonas_salina.1
MGLQTVDDRDELSPDCKLEGECDGRAGPEQHVSGPELQSEPRQTDSSKSRIQRVLSQIEEEKSAESQSPSDGVDGMQLSAVDPS